MTVLLHNTLTGQKEPLAPRDGKKISFYVCGITPYDEPHLGHGRCYVVFDLLKRVLLRAGHKVLHIQNFTDVDDKIIDRANKLGKDPATFAEPFIESFNRWMKALNVLPADQYPRVTTHMKEIVDLIQKLVENGLGYVLDGDVYYSVRKFPAYGKLSKRKLDELASGARVEVNERKQDPLDFALWKKAKPGEPAWPSPWGAGRPGWHIECSAMSMKYLGEDFDLHGGGLDLVFPHHENEIAQSVGATGKSFARMWVHNGFVTINKEKMSKSLNNFFTLKDLISQYDPMAVRYFLLSQHYRSPLNFSDHDLRAAESVWTNRVCEAYRLSANWSGADSPEAKTLDTEFYEALLNDLNSSGALGAVNQLCSLIFKSDATQGSRNFHTTLASMLDTLGLVVSKVEIKNDRALELLKERDEARAKKDWTRSDKIREELKALGFVVEDTAQGARLKPVS
jgi:cysteinyl-tRNA synthetase